MKTMGLQRGAHSPGYLQDSPVVHVFELIGKGICFFLTPDSGLTVTGLGGSHVFEAYAILDPTFSPHKRDMAARHWRETGLRVRKGGVHRRHIIDLIAPDRQARRESWLGSRRGPAGTAADGPGLPPLPAKDRGGSSGAASRDQETLGNARWRYRTR